MTVQRNMTLKERSERGGNEGMWGILWVFLEQSAEFGYL
jgi:hypothetical protein